MTVTKDSLADTEETATETEDTPADSEESERFEIGHIPDKHPRDTAGPGAYCEHTMADSKNLRSGGVVYCHTTSLRGHTTVQSRYFTIRKQSSRK